MRMAEPFQRAHFAQTGRWLRGLAAALVITLAGLAQAQAQDAAAPTVLLDGQRVHPTRLLVKYKPIATAATAGPTLAATNLRVTHEFPPTWRMAVLDVQPQARRAAGLEAQELRDRITQLRQSGQFEFVEPDHVRQTSLTPSDTFFLDGTLWGLHNNGQSGGVRGADISVTNAWDITVGSTNVIVAVLDSGIRYTHLDLASQMWRNPGEIPGDGLDNDGNGFVDDVFGINVITRSGDPNDDNGHGTHVAGTIGAAANNGQSHVGVAWNVRLMGIKIGNQFGQIFVSDEILGLGYAITNGAKIINCSFGGYGLNVAEYTAFQSANQAGVLVVAAAGNDGFDADVSPPFPASFPFDNIISVAALDRRDALAVFSNYGRTNVHLGAPGVEIMSTYNTADNAYQLLQGTSMAAPHVAGVAALVYSLTNTMTYTEARNRILLTTTPVPALASRVITSGRVNAYKALTTAQDGVLEVRVTPGPGATLLAGASATFTVEVNDLLPVNNATVLGSISGVITNQPFLNDGTAPDQVLGDNRHALSVNIPPVATSNLTLTLVVVATGKTNYTNTFTYRTATVPPNDNFPPIAKVPDGGGVVFGDNTFGSLQFGEPVHAGVTGVVKSVWWNFAPTNSTPVLVDTAGSAFDTVLAVYTGNFLTNLTQIAAINDVTVTNNGQTGIIPQGFVKFTPVAGTTYRIAVASTSTNSAGFIRLRVQPGGEPDTSPPTVVITNFVSGPLSVTNPPSGLIVTNAPLTLSGTASDPTANAIGVSQVFVRLNNGLATVASGTTNWTIPLFLTAGTNVVHVSAVDFSGNSSIPASFQVIYRVFDPFNDVLANALELSGASGGTTTNNANATLEPGEPLHAGKQGGKSVWYYFTAPADGLLSLTTSNSTFDTLLAVYTGTRVDRLTAAGANDDTPSGTGVHSDLVQAVRAGGRYYVAVDGLAGDSGTIILAHSFTAVPIFDLAVTATGGGLAFPSSGLFASNSTVDVTAVASNGFSFVTWSGDSLSLDNPLRINLTRNTSLSAVFAPRLLADGFETGALRTGIGWSTSNPGSSAPWTVQAAAGQATNATTGGTYHIRSGLITHNQTTILRLVTNCRAGNASFGYRVSSEEFGPAMGDFIEFYLNGIRQVRANGESGWQTHTFTVTAGTNSLEWRFIRDSSGDSGLNAAFLDNVDLPLVEPVNLAVPVRVTTNSVQLVSGGGVQFRVEGQTNQVYQVQASADLANWVTISTNYAPYGLIQFTDPQATTNASRYYRIILP